MLIVILVLFTIASDTRSVRMARSLVCMVLGFAGCCRSGGEAVHIRSTPTPRLAVGGRPIKLEKCYCMFLQLGGLWRLHHSHRATPPQP